MFTQEEVKNQTIETRKFDEIFSKILQFVLNTSLVFLGVFLMTVLGYLTYHLFGFLYQHFFHSQPLAINEVLKEILEFFLVFEMLVLISKYFVSGHHFPLKYFIYIGITAILRSLIVEHDNYVNVLLMSLSILILLIALYLSKSEALAKFSQKRFFKKTI